MRLAHLVNRQVTRVLRNMPRPSLARVYGFRPVRTAPESDRCLLVMSRPSEFDMAVWSAWSWLIRLRTPVRLRIGVDGTPDAARADRARDLLPGVEIVDVRGQHVGVRAETGHGWNRWLAEHPFSRKTAAILELQTRFDLIYSDADVLVFDHPDELEAALAAGKPMHQAEPFPGQTDSWLSERLGCAPNPSFNAGLMLIPRGTLDTDEIVRLFSDWTPAVTNWTTDQTLFGSLLTARDSTPFPVDRYLNRTEDIWFWRRAVDCDRSVLRHYTGPVRHRLFSQGLPLLTRINAHERR